MPNSFAKSPIVFEIGILNAVINSISSWSIIKIVITTLKHITNTIKGFSGFDELANLCNMEERWIKSHYNKLLELGMVIEDGNSFRINPEILPFLDRENSHSVAINIIKSDESINYKPIFN